METSEIIKRLEAIERHIGIAKDEPKLDRWYKRAGRSLVYLTGITRGVGYGYGFDIDGNWFDRCNGNPIFIDCLVEATPQEVEEALVREAKRRGFLTQGTFFKSFTDGGKVREVQPFECYDGKINPIKLSLSSQGLYYEEGLKISDGLCSNPRVFEDGKWAEIIEQPVDKFAELKEAHKNGAVIQRATTHTWVNDLNPTWDSYHEYRIKPEEKPKVGDVVKAWSRNEEHYVVGNLTDIKPGTENKYGVHILGVSDIRNTIYCANATTITKEEAINLLFGNQ